MKHLYVSLPVQKELCDLLAARQKIKAIKRLRDATGAGLRECKEALEHMEGRLSDPSAVIRAPWIVNSITMTSPTGKAIEVSIKDLELNFLQEMSTIGMDEVAALLDLTEFIKKWQEGHHHNS